MGAILTIISVITTIVAFISKLLGINQTATILAAGAAQQSVAEEKASEVVTTAVANVAATAVTDDDVTKRLEGGTA